MSTRRTGPAGSARHRSSISPWAIVPLAWLAAVAMTLGIVAAGDGERPLFRDTDDAMRAVQVLRWIDGAGWRDLREPRLDPPAGVVTHWSRLPDIPIAAAILAAEPFVGRDRALEVAAHVVPFGLLLAAIGAVAWAARPFGPAVAAAAPVLAAFCPVFLTKFFPGALDHHNWQLILAALLLGATLRLTDGPPRGGAVPLLVPVLVAGAAGAAGLWIGGEMLPWVAVFHACLALRWVLDPQRSASQGVAASVAMAGFAALVLWLALPPGDLRQPVCDAFSPAYVAYAAAGVPFWLLLAAVGARTGDARIRTGAVALATAAVAAAFLLLFPECRSGPLGAIPPELREAWLSRVSEARGLVALTVKTPGHAVQLTLLPAIALFVCLTRIRRGADAHLWRVQALFLLGAAALSFVQVRLLPFASLFALAPAVWLLLRLWNCLSPMPVAMRAVARAGLLLAFTPIPYAAALSPAEPVKRSRFCDAAAVGAAVRDAHRGYGQALVASFIDMGPSLLLRTPVSVLAAPYHRNVDGNLDAIAILRETPDEALAVVRRRSVDFVAICTSLTEQNWYAADRPGGLAAALAAGRVPSWLEPIPVPADPSVLLYRVRPE